MNGYQRTLDVALRHPGWILTSFFATFAATAWLFLVCPRASSDPGHRLFDRPVRGRPCVSPDQMMALAGETYRRCGVDPDVASSSRPLAARARQPGLYLCRLKPLSERHFSAMDVINRLRPELKQVMGAGLVLPHAGHQCGRTAITGLISIHAAEQKSGELNSWAAKLSAGKENTRQDFDQPGLDGQTVTLTINRDVAARFQISPPRSIMFWRLRSVRSRSPSSSRS